ncbi:MAG: FMN reductase [Ahrensia sp.]|nr:FMN reductase [Ahrensia sp.]
MKLLGLSGSLRAGSGNTALLHAFAATAPDGFDVEVFDGLGDLPLFSPDKEADTPQSVLRLAARVEACDGILIACPEYAHGIPGAFKNALDWLVSRFEIPGKPAMLVHASTRSLYLREHLREVLRTISCRLYPEEEFEVHLIRKDRREIDAILSTGEMRAAMRMKLEAFARFAAQEG